MSKPSNQSIMKYKKKAYDRLNIVIPKGRSKDLAMYIKENGGSINHLVNTLLQEKLAMTEEEWKTRITA